jgi:hypothetical protein
MNLFSLHPRVDAVPLSGVKTVVAIALGLLGGLAGGSASAACFQVFERGGELVYRSNRSPVDMSQQLHATVPVLAPDATMVFTLNDSLCTTQVDLLAERAQLAQASAERSASLNKARPAVRRARVHNAGL